MGHPGAKRKSGKREGSGKLQRPTAKRQNELEREKQYGVMAVVIDQPHRKLKVADTPIDPTEPMLGCPLGVFLLCNMQDVKRRRIYFDAGLAYRNLKHQWAVNWGQARSEVPADDRRTGTGNGPSWETQAGWWKQIRAIETKIIFEGGGKRVLDGIVGLLISETWPTRLTAQEILGALWIISTELGKLDGRLNKMA